MPKNDQTPEVAGLWRAPISIVRSQMGTPTDELMTLINKIAPVPFKKRDDVFVVPGVPSTTAADTYFTHMDRNTSLKRFEKALREGSAFLDSHDIYRLPIGSSFWGEVRDVEGGKVEGVDADAEVFALWYMVRHHNVPGSGNTDDYIRGIESGITRKLSIGFGGPEMRIVCDEDGTELWDWDSPFWPGKRLEDGRMTLYTVYDADLFETSQVYKNATPGALISRWQALITDRRINAAEAERLSRAVNHRFTIPNFQSLRPVSARPSPSQDETDSTYRYARIGRPVDPRPLERADLEGIGYDLDGVAYDRRNCPVASLRDGDGVVWRNSAGEVIAELAGVEESRSPGRDRRGAESDLSDLYELG